MNNYYLVQQSFLATFSTLNSGFGQGNTESELKIHKGFFICFKRLMISYISSGKYDLCQP